MRALVAPSMAHRLVVSSSQRRHSTEHARCRPSEGGVGKPTTRNGSISKAMCASPWAGTHSAPSARRCGSTAFRLRTAPRPKSRFGSNAPMSPRGAQGSARVDAICSSRPLISVKRNCHSWRRKMAPRPMLPFSLQETRDLRDISNNSQRASTTEPSASVRGRRSTRAPSRVIRCLCPATRSRAPLSLPRTISRTKSRSRRLPSAHFQSFALMAR